MTKKYQAKVSYIMLVVIFLLFFIPLIFGAINNGIHKEFYVLIAILVPSYLFILNIFLGTEYWIDNDVLKIKCGFLYTKSISIHEIKTISKTNSLISSPAPSLDRIEITYAKFDDIIISPKDKVTLAKDLTLINPNIKNHITEN
ncbi:PH domain-containing protein [Confluentibacter citreus]|uniref:PH domain-containing protein n=1 Tax=Confluentibacter citreus TaxID=2007307 RepID=UPI000C28B93E|nr:PH domain-containing protein [Confluentibacter citreus]